MDHQSASQIVDFNDQQKHVIITSICCTLMSKIKLMFQNPLKNKQLAQNQNLLSIIELIGENLLPHYCNKNYKNSQKLSYMHSLCYLLTSKIQAVFTSGVIKTCIDQNWDLKGLKAVLLRLLSELGLTPAEDARKLQELFDKLIQSQNLQSQSCIKAISYYLKNRNKANIDEDDLKNPIVSFQTTFDFVKDEIQKFRSQNMSHTCFTVLHPWAYDLDLVDFKYVINKDQTVKVSKALEESIDAQVFWLSYFKSQLSCSADEFIVALKEMAEMNDAADAFDEQYDVMRLFLHQSNFVINVNDHKQEIVKFIKTINKHSKSHNILHDQVKLRLDNRPQSEYIDESKLQGTSTQFTVLNQYLFNSNLVQLNTQQSQNRITFKRLAPELQPSTKQPSNLYLKFTNVDTEELKDLEIKFDGNLAQFKVGEGDCNHYIICNDKKLWESQFMILNKDGKYYIRDLGIVHTSRIKVNSHTQLQIHQGALLDLGKVVHYHVDKLLHEKVPTQSSNPNFIVMKGSQANYKIDDEAILRARPTWISADENKDLVQNEIILENSEKSIFSVGRSNKRDVEIKLKAVSADHCKIEYNREKGWFVHEMDKDRLSSNGTFVFMKSLQQMEDHEPSDFIPLFDGMTVSFINYELQVRIESKTQEELAKSVCVPIDQLQMQTPGSTRSVQSSQPDIQEKVTHKKETPQKAHNAQDSDVYHEELQATHNQKTQPQVIEEHKSVRSLHSQHHDDINDDQEEVKSSHIPPVQHVESQHSHRSSKQSVHQSQQQIDDDDHDSNVKGVKSSTSLKDDDLQQHNQSVHSQKQSIHDDIHDNVHQQQSLHQDPSQKSVRQSVQSMKDLVHDDDDQQQQDVDNFQVHHTEDDNIKDDYIEERKSQLSQRSSAHNKASAHKDDQDIIDDQVQSSQHHHQTHHDDEEEEKHSQIHHSNNNQLDDSPKASVSKQSQHRDDDEIQQMQRSYSQHHIEEVLDQVHGGSEVRQSKHTLIHSDDEEEDDQKSKNKLDNDDKQEAFHQTQSVHDDQDQKSHRSQVSPSKQQHHTTTHHDDEEDKEPYENRDDNKNNQSQHHQSQHSLHQQDVAAVASQKSLKHDQSQHDDIVDVQQQSNVHNQSVHSSHSPQKDTHSPQHQDDQEEVKSQHHTPSQKLLHNDKNEVDVDVTDKHQQHQTAQSQLSHRSNKSQASPLKQDTQHQQQQHHNDDEDQDQQQDASSSGHVYDKQHQHVEQQQQQQHQTHHSQHDQQDDQQNKQDAPNNDDDQ